MSADRGRCDWADDLHRPLAVSMFRSPGLHPPQPRWSHANRSARFHQVIREQLVAMYEAHDVTKEVLETAKHDLTHNCCRAGLGNRRGLRALIGRRRTATGYRPYLEDSVAAGLAGRRYADRAHGASDRRSCRTVEDFLAGENIDKAAIYDVWVPRRDRLAQASGPADC